MNLSKQSRPFALEFILPLKPIAMNVLSVTLAFVRIQSTQRAYHLTSIHCYVPQLSHRSPLRPKAHPPQNFAPHQNHPLPTPIIFNTQIKNGRIPKYLPSEYHLN